MPRNHHAPRNDDGQHAMLFWNRATSTINWGEATEFDNCDGFPASKSGRIFFAQGRIDERGLGVKEETLWGHIPAALC